MFDIFFLFAVAEYPRSGKIHRRKKRILKGEKKLKKGKIN